MRNEQLLKFTKWTLDFMFYMGIIVEVTLPFTLKYLGIYYVPSIQEKYIPVLIIFIIAGIFGISIICELKKMMKTVIDQNCFVYKNVKSLRNMGVVSFSLTILFIIKLCVFPTPATFIIILTFFIAGLFSLVLSCVFQEAVRFKEENDLTI